MTDELEYKEIVLILDKDNYVEQWGENLNGEGSLISVTLPASHPFFANSCASYRFIDGELVFVPDRQIKFAREDKKELLALECKQKILEGFLYEHEKIMYRVSYSVNKQSLFEQTEQLFKMKSITSVDWEFIKDGQVQIIALDKLAFMTLYTYATLVKKEKIDKLNCKLYPLVDEKETIEEIATITWDSIPDEPLPEKPVIDLDGDGEISQEEFDALAKENKELKQKVELNELALMDAINMLSSMITG